MPYTICYNYQGKQMVMQYSENNLCGHDAVYYALLHSGVALRNGLSNWAGSYTSIRQSAEQFGVTDVKWCHSDLALS